MAEDKTLPQRIAEWFLSGSETEKNIKKHNKALEDAYRNPGDKATDHGQDDNEGYQKVKDSDINQK